MKLTEIQRIEGSADDTNVFRHVKLLGITSKNGYSYNPAAIEKAKTLYEGVGVFIDHAKNARSYSDRIGYIQNPTVVEGELFGDFVMNPKHAMSEAILWDAQHNTQGVGFSHSIDGALNKKSNLVESIDRVYSVDIVANPATCQSFFEQEQQEQTSISELKQENQALATRISELETQIKSFKSVKPVAIAPQPPVANQASYADWLQNLKG